MPQYLCTLLSFHCFYFTPSSGMNEPICAKMPLPASEYACVSVCVCSLWHTVAVGSLILRENTDTAFCFCPCFTSRLVFISTMVIGFSSFYGPCVSVWMEESSKGNHWSKGLQRPPCHSAHFYRVNLLWMLLEGKWPLGNCNKQNACEQRGEKNSRAIGGMANAFSCCITGLFFSLYAY